MDPDARRSTAHANRSCTAATPVPRAGGRVTVLASAAWPVRHRNPRSWCEWSPLSPRRCRGRNPDASLSAFAVHARRLAGRHGAAPRESSFDSGQRHGTVIQTAGSGHSRRHSIDCHGHSRDRCEPARRTAHNCRVDTTAPLPPRSPAAHWTGRRDAGIKALQTRLHAARAEGPGFCQECVRAFVCLASASRIRGHLSNRPGRQYRPHLPIRSNRNQKEFAQKRGELPGRSNRAKPQIPAVSQPRLH